MVSPLCPSTNASAAHCTAETLSGLPIAEVFSLQTAAATRRPTNLAGRSIDGADEGHLVVPRLALRRWLQLPPQQWDGHVLGVCGHAAFRHTRIISRE